VCRLAVLNSDWGYDTGAWMYLSQRMLAGARLYVDVTDNKLPPLYWIGALYWKTGFPPRGDVRDRGDADHGLGTGARVDPAPSGARRAPWRCSSERSSCAPRSRLGSTRIAWRATRSRPLAHRAGAARAA
jgi:hypothetical protein